MTSMRHWIRLCLYESKLDVRQVRSRRDMDGLLRRYGWVRLALHGDHMVGWDAGDFTHGDYVEEFGEHINLNVAKENGQYVVEFSYPSPEQDVRILGTTPQQLRENPVFQRVFATLPVTFRDHETWDDVAP